MGPALIDPLVHDLRHQRMQAERCGDQVPDIRVPLGRGGGQRWDVLTPVSSGGQEVGKDHDGLGAARDAAVERSRHGRFGDLHVCRLDDRIGARANEHRHDFLEQIVARFPPRAVIDDDNSDLAGRKFGRIRVHQMLSHALRILCRFSRTLRVALRVSMISGE